MKHKSGADQYDEKEAKRRFEQALRGARAAESQPMKDISSKREKKRPAKEAG